MKIKVYISHVFRYKYLFTQEKKQLSIDWIWEFNFKVFVELYVCVTVWNYITFSPTS